MGASGQTSLPGRRADGQFPERLPFMFHIVEASAIAAPAFSDLHPDELSELAERQFAEAMEVEAEPERLRALTVAEALMNLAAIKRRLLEYERRLLN
jgi:hypothetical protein